MLYPSENVFGLRFWSGLSHQVRDSKEEHAADPEQRDECGVGRRTHADALPVACVEIISASVQPLLSRPIRPQT